MICHQIHRTFAVILYNLVSDTVGSKCLLQKCVTHVFFVFQDAAGSNDIQFTYETKGLFWGKVITAVGFGSLIVYLGAVRFTGRKKKEEAQPVEKNA